MNQKSGSEEGSKVALELAWKKLTDSNIQELAEGAGATFHNGEISLPHFNQRIVVDITTERVRIGTEDLTISERILALHYLLGCDRIKPTGKLISFAQAPGGDLYYSAFKKRSIDRLAELFGEAPERIIELGPLLGGEPLKMATAAIKVPFYPMLPVAVLVWQGDDEVAAAANILFDESAVRIMATEDLAVVAASVVSRLAKATIADQ